jgi:hypothetical protein
MMLVPVLLTCSCLVQDAPTAAPDSTTTLLREVDAATRAVETARYEGRWYGTGALAGTRPSMEGTVVLEKSERGFGHYRIEGVSYQPQSGTKTTFVSASDGELLTYLDANEKTMVQMAAGGRGFPGTAVYMIEYGHPAPFSDEIDATLVEHEGRTLVHGVVCDVVYVEYAVAGGARARWYFGVEDHLPRKVERLRDVDGVPAAMVLEIAGLELGVDTDATVFRPERPDGYTQPRLPPGIRLQPGFRNGVAPLRLDG